MPDGDRLKNPSIAPSPMSDVEQAVSTLNEAQPTANLGRVAADRHGGLREQKSPLSRADLIKRSLSLKYLISFAFQL